MNSSIYIPPSLYFDKLGDDNKIISAEIAFASILSWKINFNQLHVNFRFPINVIQNQQQDPKQLNQSELIFLR